ncbi:MAG: MoaD/ThiS family protein [Actinobacteria bacterium]|nr:MoaD/ThiS family protein [Actinomycetota bacterium]
MSAVAGRSGPASGGVRVRVVLLGTFADYVPRGEKGSRMVLDLPGPEPLRAVRARLGIPDDAPRIVYRRGDAIDDDQILLDGDEVSFVSPIAGG